MSADYNDTYNTEVQELYINCLLGDPTAFTLCRNILDDVYFSDRLRSTIRFVLDYADEFKALPRPAQIRAKTGFAAEPFDSQGSDNHRQWFLKEVESFCRYKALELAILEGVDLLQKGKGGELERRVRDAMTISLMSDLGTDYFSNPRERMQAMLDKSSFLSTGWETLDYKLYGGFTVGGLNVFAGGSGSGKSLFLQNLAINWAEMGLNVAYFTFELSEGLISTRLDAMVAGKGTDEIYKEIDETSRTVAVHGKSAGKLIIKALPGGSTANDLRAFLKEYEIQTGRKIDAVCVDYLDLMYPNSRSLVGKNAFDRDKETSEELRSMATECKVLCATASQLNRGSVEAAGEFDHSHIAGGMSKINTADNVFAIYTNNSLRERGIYVLHFLKTRSSAAVGQKIELGYNPVSMRITDVVVDAAERQVPINDLRAELKRKTRSQGIAARKESADDLEGTDEIFDPNGEADTPAKPSVLGIIAKMKKDKGAAPLQ